MTSYVAVLPLIPLEIGEAFSVTSWPLHVTIVSNFSSELDAAAVGSILEPDCGALDVEIGGEALFGRRENIRVSLVEHSDALLTLHGDLVARLRHAGVEFENPDYLDEGYHPHVTATKRARANAGDRLRLTQIALVDMRPDGEQSLRRVVWAARLK